MTKRQRDSPPTTNTDHHDDVGPSPTNASIVSSHFHPRTSAPAGGGGEGETNRRSEEGDGVQSSPSSNGALSGSSSQPPRHVGRSDSVVSPPSTISGSASLSTRSGSHSTLTEPNQFLRTLEAGEEEGGSSSAGEESASTSVNTPELTPVVTPQQPPKNPSPRESSSTSSYGGSDSRNPPKLRKTLSPRPNSFSISSRSLSAANSSTSGVRRALTTSFQQSMSAASLLSKNNDAAGEAKSNTSNNGEGDGGSPTTKASSPSTSFRSSRSSNSSGTPQSAKSGGNKSSKSTSSKSYRSSSSNKSKSSSSPRSSPPTLSALASCPKPTCGPCCGDSSSDRKSKGSNGKKSQKIGKKETPTVAEEEETETICTESTKPMSFHGNSTVTMSTSYRSEDYLQTLHDPLHEGLGGSIRTVAEGQDGLPRRNSSRKEVIGAHDVHREPSYKLWEQQDALEAMVQTQFQPAKVYSTPIGPNRGGRTASNRRSLTPVQSVEASSEGSRRISSEGTPRTSNNNRQQRRRRSSAGGRSCGGNSDYANKSISEVVEHFYYNPADAESDGSLGGSSSRQSSITTLLFEECCCCLLPMFCVDQTICLGKGRRRSICCCLGARTEGEKCLQTRWDKCAWVSLLVAVIALVGCLMAYEVFLPRSGNETSSASPQSAMEDVMKPKTNATNNDGGSNPLVSTGPPVSSKQEEDPLKVGTLLVALTQLSSDELLLDPSSPQHRAMSWMLYDDEYMDHLLVNIKNERGDDATRDRHMRIAQRYSLAVLYFSTTGPPPVVTEDAPSPSSWTNEYHFLSNRSECEWNDEVIDREPPLVKGVSCDGEGVVTQIDLEENHLSGTIPRELDVLKDLKALNLQDNSIDGTLPRSFFGNWTQMETIRLSNNTLSGSISPAVNLLSSSLQEMDLSHNNFTGALPSDLGENWTDVQYLTFNDNEFSGEIPSSLVEAVSAREIYLHNNLFAGDASFLCPLGKLEVIGIDCGRVNCTCDTCVCMGGVADEPLPNHTEEGMPVSANEENDALPQRIRMHLRGNGL